MTHSVPILKALSGNVQNIPPVWLMRQAGRYLPEYQEIRRNVPDFLSFCYDVEKATEVTLQPIRRYSLDAAIVFSDILVIPDALEQQVRFEKGEGPVLSPIRNRDAILALQPEQLSSHLAPVYKILTRLREKLPDETALLGFAGAPWTLMTYMVEGKGSKDFATLKAWYAREPENVLLLRDILVEVIAEHLIAQLASGAQAVQLFDSWAGAVPATWFDALVTDPTRSIVKKIRAQVPDAKIIGFPRGVGEKILRYAQETGVDALGLDSSMDIVWAAEHLPENLCLQGNLESASLVAGGSAMLEETARICRVMQGRPFIFNLGHGIWQQTPPENVAELVTYIRSGNWQT